MIPKINMLKQLAFCLITLNRFDKAEEIVKNNFTGEYEKESYYPLGLIFAGQGKIPEAIENLKLEIKENPDRKEAKDFIFKLLMHEAGVKANQKDWKALSSILTLAFELSPDTDEARKEFLRFKNILPMSYLKEGNREKSTETFKEELKKDIKNPWIIHSLALIYYWWAISEEEKYFKGEQTETINPEKLDQLWDCTIAHWILLMNMTEFWRNWAKEKKKLWKMDIPVDTVTNLKKKLLDENLFQVFTNFIDGYKIQKKKEDVQRHEEYLTKLLFEKKSARYYKDYISKLIKSSKPIPLPQYKDKSALEKFNISAGLMFFKEYKKLDEVNTLISSLLEADPDNVKLCMLNIIYSPDNLGYFLILADDKNNPKQALEELNKLSGGKKKKTAISESATFKYVNANVMMKMGIMLVEQGEVLKALDNWSSAKQIINKSSKGSDQKSFKKLFSNLNKELEDVVAQTCEQEAKRKNQAKKTKEAIKILEKGVKLVNKKSLKEHLAILYSESGFERLNKKKYTEARKDFEKALALAPGNERAKQGIGTAYNNEGVATRNSDKAIQLFEKALKYDPSSNVFATNLAGAYNSKAVSIINSLGQYSRSYDCDPAIKILKKGLKLLNPSIDLSIIEGFSFMDETLFNSMTSTLPDDTYKTMLSNLWIAEKSKANLRGY